MGDGIFHIDKNQADVWNPTARRILELDTDMAVNQRKFRQQQLDNDAWSRASNTTTFWSLVKTMLMDDSNGERRDPIERSAANENTGWFGRGRGRNTKRVKLASRWEAEPARGKNNGRVPF